MIQPSSLRLALGFATLAYLACLPAVASAVQPPPVVINDNDILEFKGSATDIGVQRGPHQIGGIEYRIEGDFRYGGPLDLSKATLTFHHLLDEQLEDGNLVLEDGNLEMVLTIDNADLVCPAPPEDEGCRLTPDSLPSLLASSSSKPIEGKYESPARFRPQVRVQIKNKAGVYQFNVRLDRGLSPQVGRPAGTAAANIAFPADHQFPRGCENDPADNRAKTRMRTGFTIDDRVNAPVVLDFVRAWECSQPGRYHLRSR